MGGTVVDPEVEEVPEAEEAPEEAVVEAGAQELEHLRNLFMVVTIVHM